MVYYDLVDIFSALSDPIRRSIIEILAMDEELSATDSYHIDLVPVLLGEGIRLFDHLGIQPVDLETTELNVGPGVIHITFRVVKKGK